MFTFGGKKNLKNWRKKKDLRGTISQGVEGYGNWACLERKEENLLIMFKISQNLVLVPERFLGGLEHFWWTGWCNHFKNPTWKSGLGRRLWGHSGARSCCPQVILLGRNQESYPWGEGSNEKRSHFQGMEPDVQATGLRMGLSRGQAHMKRGVGRLDSGLTLSPLSRGGAWPPDDRKATFLMARYKVPWRTQGGNSTQENGSFPCISCLVVVQAENSTWAAN